MINRLRKKFILINMLLVSSVLVIVFAVICISGYRQFQAETRNALSRMLERKMDFQPPRHEFNRNPPPGLPGLAIPVFSVVLDSGGRILNVIDDNVTVSDEILTEAVERALTSGRIEGVIPQLNLRYMIRKTGEGVQIAFADRSSEKSSFQNILVSSFLAGFGGLAGFFAVSVYLSIWALRPVEAAWQQQKQFAVDASHELKTPLTIILANMEILLKHPKEHQGDQKKWLVNTRTEAMRMKGLVDDLLFLAKTDVADLDVKSVQINFSDLVWSILLLFESLAYEKGVSLQDRIDPDIVIDGDEKSLKQLVGILLDNGCKYAGQAGTVTVQLQQQQDRALLTVHNTGSFISREALQHVFERFYRGDRSRERSRGGYGLGLAIAKNIVDNHRGKISVDSGEGEGTMFTVLLPLHLSSRQKKG